MTLPSLTRLKELCWLALDPFAYDLAMPEFAKATDPATVAALIQSCEEMESALLCCGRSQTDEALAAHHARFSEERRSSALSPIKIEVIGQDLTEVEDACERAWEEFEP